MTENEIATIVYNLHKEILTNIGSGMLEHAYQEILAYELREAGLKVSTEVELPLQYKKLSIEKAYRIDILVEDKVILELKVVEKLLPVHASQLLTYLKLSNKKLGLLLNFGGPYATSGIKRVVNGL